MLSRIAIAALFVCAAVPARAEIYSWRDAKGNLVLSNKRPDDTAPTKTYDVPAATNIRATRYVAPQKSRLYDDLINEHAELNGIRADLVRAVVQVESAFNTYAKSPKGALGLMQLMPATAKQYGVVNPFNPIENVRAGVAYLRELLNRFENNEELALAAYNAGPNAVARYGEAVPPYRETQNYVAKIGQLVGTTTAERVSEPKAPGNRLYKITEIVDGREVIRYTDKKPASGTYTVIGK